MHLSRPFAFAIFLSLGLCPGLSHAAVEVVAGEPVTTALSEPFSVDLDSKGTLYGVEFTKKNRVYRLTGGEGGYLAGTDYDAEKNKPQGDMHDGADPMKAIFNGMHDLAVLDD